MSPTTTRSATSTDTEPDAPNYVDVEPRLRNSNNLVAIFSQRRWDGVITFGIHREFEKFDDQGNAQTPPPKTAFIPENLAESYLQFVGVTLEHVKKLQAKRRSGGLPFPEGGLQQTRRRRA